MLTFQRHLFALIAAIILHTCPAGHAAVQVTVGYNDNDHATPAFVFTNVPSPSASAAATIARIALVDGLPDPHSGAGLYAFNDGDLPDRPDQPLANFFFQDGTDGGRVRLDFTNRITVKQVNTYSWHPNTRGPQKYTLYGDAGSDAGFNESPKRGTDPATCGWQLIAVVDTISKTKPANGGQFGVSIADSRGVIGKFRHLLFDISRTEDADSFGNTFYSAINVVDANTSARPNRFVINTTNGQCDITFNTVKAPEFSEWADHTLAPLLASWYPQITAMLPSPGFVAPRKFTVTIRPGEGVAYTIETRVVANSKWLGQAIQTEGAGAFVHEMAHVVQQYPDGGPGWLVEGIADYVRWFKYEPQSHGADIVWMRQQPNFMPQYDASYRVSANFLNWVVEKYNKDLVVQMNAALREGRYDETLWKKYTGKTAPELGAEWQREVHAQLSNKK
jgi:hypothetical protein